VLVATGLLFGCSKGTDPPHALEDAAAASKRASEAMKNSDSTEKNDESTVNPTSGEARPSKPAQSQ
jgi:hypothetical protein